MSKKSAFVGYTEDEVKKIEAHYFVILFGGDFICEDREYIFDKKEVSKLHKRTLKNLIDIVERGDEKDRRYAIDLIGSLTVKPLRFH